jgi:hypothetical protein
MSNLTLGTIRHGYCSSKKTQETFMSADAIVKNLIGSIGAFIILYALIALWNFITGKRSSNRPMKDMYDYAREGNIEKVMGIMRNNPAAIQYQNTAGESALHCAVKGKRLDLVALLLHSGASTSATTKAGVNALDIARAMKWEDGLALLDGQKAATK